MSHERTPPPEHCVVPGAHTPVHAPLAHAAFEHVCVVDHVPVGSHVCTESFEHRTAPGPHDPVHDPITHAYGHDVAVPHEAVSSHV